MKQTILSKLISFPTVTSDLAANRKALLWCQELLSGKGIKSVLAEFAGWPILVWGKVKSPKMMINSHIDVVPAPAKLFRARLIGEKTFGRGAADTKGGITALLNLPRELIEAATNKRILFSLVSDEEVGGESTKKLIAKLEKLEFAIFVEPTNLRITNQAKGIMQIKITHRGKAAHGSRPWAGWNAITILSDQLSKFLESHPIPKSETRETTFNFSLISGGAAINQVPDSCELMVDIRFNPADKLESILKILKRGFPGCKIEPVKIESPIFCSSDNSPAKTLVKSIEEIGVGPKFEFEHGSSDARHCTARGIPAVVFGPIGGNLHADKEWVDNKSIDLCRKTIENFIINC